MHDVLEPGVNKAKKLINSENGFKVLDPHLLNPVKVVELPNGTKIILDGHHRVKAMQELGESFVPVQYDTYASLLNAVNADASVELLSNVYYVLTIGKKRENIRVVGYQATLNYQV